LANGGLFIPGDVKRNRNSEAVELARRWTRKTGLKLADLTVHLYPSAETLLPFLLLISFALAANPDSISLLKRSGVRRLEHPSSGPCLEISMDKPRSGEIPQALLKVRETLSEGALLQQVLAMTESLTQLADQDDRDYVFLAATRYGFVQAIRGRLRSDAMAKYLRTHNFPATTLKALRSARITDDWIARKDPLWIWRLHGGSSLAIVASYVIRGETESLDEKAMAQFQSTMLQVPTSGRKLEKMAASTPSHTCADVFDSSKPRDANGFCVSYLWPYNDVHFMFNPDENSVVHLLRDYHVLCEAEKAISPARFAKLYAPKKKLIETEYLPLIDSELMERAERLVAAMPKLPPILEVL